MQTIPRNGRRQILFLTPQFPYPPEQGTSIRNYNLLVEVARRHDVSVLSFVEEGQDDPGPLADLCRVLRTVHVPVRTPRDRLETLLTTPLPDMARRLFSPEFAAALRTLLDEYRFDVVQIEGIELAPYAFVVSEWLGDNAPTLIFDDHNAEYVLQRRAYQTDARNPRRWAQACYSLTQWQRLERFERRVCELADAVVCVSEADAEALRQLVPGLQPVVVPNGVDVERYRPDLPDSIPLQHPALVFTGKMDFRPNVDAMLWFCRQVWPKITARMPEAHLYIVGKNPHPRLASLARDERVTITGYVQDNLPYFGGADVYIVPLRIGGGTRLKVLEAMATGRALVSTTLGIEGIALTPGQHVLVGDSADAFADAVLELLHDPARRQIMGQAAREFVVEHYDWGRIVPRLDSLYMAL
ncbi:MAG: glycosyltransferase [Chloroflexi bacterium]|jgi:sugar transferase (PEP-CTERM/EpsH1 system associated)|nr:glycosyltransferase [Chloroflexota bacterium]